MQHPGRDEHAHHSSDCLNDGISREVYASLVTYSGMARSEITIVVCYDIKRSGTPPLLLLVVLAPVAEAELGSPKRLYLQAMWLVSLCLERCGGPVSWLTLAHTKRKRADRLNQTAPHLIFFISLATIYTIETKFPIWSEFRG